MWDVYWAALPHSHWVQSTQTAPPASGFSRELGRFCYNRLQEHHFLMSLLLALSSNYSPITDTHGQKIFCNLEL